MRTIKFRGIRLLSNDWEYGNLIRRPDGGHFIETGDMRLCPVQDFSIGQYTGLVDKNGKEIYEGDIIKIEDEGVMLKPKVVDFNNGMFGSGEWSLAYYGEDIIEVIGNIHDNPELLKNND